MDAFRRTDREVILACLTDDIEWSVPGAFSSRGKDEFNSHIVDPGFAPLPDIAVTRYIEGGDVVVAEGTVKAPCTDGTVSNLLFCDVFTMRDGKVAKLTSYLVQLP
jgi:ketosteroid isomerase-like protein